MTKPLVIDEIGDELLTAEDFADLNIEECVDLEEGKLVCMGLNNIYHSKILTRLAIRFGSFVLEQKLGEIFSGDVGVFTQKDPTTIRGIDLAFVSNERLEEQPITGAKVLDVAPEIAVEITSPSNGLAYITKKNREYFKIGVKEVWVIITEAHEVHVYRSPKDIEVYILDEDDAVTCPDILPGFALPLEDIFDGVPRDID